MRERESRRELRTVVFCPLYLPRLRLLDLLLLNAAIPAPAAPAVASASNPGLLLLLLLLLTLVAVTSVM